MKTGFIGLGIMGKPMARNLLKAGYKLVVYDVNAEAVRELAAAGAETAASPKEVARQCDVIVTMLPNSPHVKAVALGPNGIIEGVRAGMILVDMSSIAPLAAQEVAKSLAEKGVEMLDAPVSGGEPKAIEGTLSIMVGGKKEIFERCKEMLGKMGTSVVLCGAIGAGNTTKLANQIIVALNIAAMSEALVLGAKAGRQSRDDLPGHPGRPGGQHRSGRQGADGLERQLQAGVPHRAAYQGPGQRPRDGS